MLFTEKIDLSVFMDQSSDIKSDGDNQVKEDFVKINPSQTDKHTNSVNNFIEQTVNKTVTTTEHENCVLSNNSVIGLNSIIVHQGILTYGYYYSYK